MAESELEKTLKNQTELAKVLTSEFEKLGLTIAQQNKIISKASAANSKDTRKRKEDLESLIDNESELSDAVKERSKAETEANRKAEKGCRELKETMKEMPDVWKGVGKSSRATFTKVRKDLEKEFSKTIASLQKNSKAGIYDANSFLTAKDQKTVIKRLNEIDEAMNEIDDRTVGKHFLDNITKAKKLSSGIFKDKTGNTMRGSGATLQEMGKVSGGVKGTIEGKVGSGMMGAAKFMPGIGAAISIGSLLLDALNAADKLMVDSKKSYGAVGGVQFKGGTFANRSSEYNKEIRDPIRNVRLGTKYTEWEGMFKSMAGAGATLDVIVGKFGSLDDVMNTVKKTSLLLGVSTEVVGEAYATQAQELNASLGTIRDGMLDVARGAKLAGVESSKFYQNVVSTTMALASFGNFTKAAAAAQSAFANSSGLSKEEGSKTAKTLFEQFGDKDRNLTLAASLNGTGKIGALIDKRISELENQIKNASSTEERDRLKTQQSYLKIAKGKGDDVAYASAMKYIPEFGAEVLMEYLDQIFGKDKSLIDMSMDTSGIAASGLIDPSLVDAFGKIAIGLKTSMEGSVDRFETIIKSGNKEQQSYLGELSNLLSGGLKKEDDIKKLEFILKKLGLNADDIFSFTKSIQSDTMTFGEFLKDAIKNKKDIDINAYAKKFITNSQTPGRGIGSVLEQKESDIQAKSLITAKDELDIAKDSLLYTLSDNDLMKFAVSLLKFITTNTAKIVGIMTFGKDNAAINQKEINSLHSYTSWNDNPNNLKFKEGDISDLKKEGSSLKGIVGSISRGSGGAYTKKIEDNIAKLWQSSLSSFSNDEKSKLSLDRDDILKIMKESGYSDLSNKSSASEVGNFLENVESNLKKRQKEIIKSRIENPRFIGEKDEISPYISESKALQIAEKNKGASITNSENLLYQQDPFSSLQLDPTKPSNKAPVTLQGTSSFAANNTPATNNITVNTYESKKPTASVEYAF